MNICHNYCIRKGDKIYFTGQVKLNIYQDCIYKWNIGTQRIQKDKDKMMHNPASHQDVHGLNLPNNLMFQTNIQPNQSNCFGDKISFLFVTVGVLCLLLTVP